MRFWRPSAPCTALSLVLAAGVTAMAGPVTQHQAQAMVSRWLQVTPRPLKAALDARVEQVLTHGDGAGHTLFHEVRLTGGGFVVVAPDDLLEPVIAFSPTGSLDGEGSSLLNLMLRRDLPKRLEGLKAARPDFMSLGAHRKGPSAAQKWEQLQGTASAPLETTSVDLVDDPRVQPLVQSVWSQEKAGGKVTYNYYAPSYYPIGCVATALGQLMRFHQFPTAPIGVHAFPITVDKVASTVKTMGGDTLGGAYNWSLMPLDPGTATSSAERQMIGSLLYDAAISVNMAFASGGSGAVTGKGSEALRSLFGYSNAVYGYNGGGELLGSGLYDMVQPSLDAGYPVVFAISGVGGHAVVCDGYGYNGGSLYHHLNMGWGGSENAWYNLPNIGTDYNFKMVHGCLYNVFPSGTGEIYSGRVTDETGHPVAGAQVSNGTLTATTNALGVYALTHATPGIQKITASKGSAVFTQAVRVSEKVSADYGAVGNLWGLDLVQSSSMLPKVTVQPVAQEVKVGGVATFTVGATGTGPLSFSWTKGGQPVGLDSPVYTTEKAVIKDDQAMVQVKVSNGVGDGVSQAAPYSVVYLYNGAFEKGNAGWDLYDPDVVLSVNEYKDVVQPHGGLEWLILGDWSKATTDFASQELALPADATSLDLSLWLGIANKASTPVAATNVFRVQVLDTSNNVLGILLTRDNTAAETDSTGKVMWKSCGPLNLLPYKGQNVKLRMESVQPGGTDTGTIFAVDDLSLTVTTGAFTAVTPSNLVMVPGAQAPFKATVTAFQADNRVNWTVGAGGGLFSPVQTAGDGVASTVFTGGSTPGTFTLTATPVETAATAGTASVTLVDPANVTVAVSPTATTVLTGVPVTFTSTVSLLTDAATTWTTTNGGTFGTTSANGATWSATAQGTYTITATSHGATSRSAAAQVNVVAASAVQLVMDKPAVTALPGTPVTLTVTGDLGAGVNWTVTAPATKVDAGTSTTVTLPAAKPLHPVLYTVTASHKLDSTKTATATLTVKGSDLNADDALDPRDLLAFAKEWGKGVISPANLKGTGTVDDSDLNALLSQM